MRDALIGRKPHFKFGGFTSELKYETPVHPEIRIFIENSNFLMNEISSQMLGVTKQDIRI
jgi:hypothetical protein